MRNTLITVGLVLLAAVVGMFIYFSGRGQNVQKESLPAVAATHAAAVPVPFMKIAQGARSTVTTRINYSITSADQLSKLWKMIDATSTPPVVDFKTQMVIAVFAGQKPTAGYAISVSKITDTESRMVSVMLASSEGACSTKKSTIAPYEVVVVPSTTLPFAHEDISTTVSCPK
ncbi:MAG: protease complex subunit PrcB family protein [Candidatus Kaiserbacteria bacterium]|nr:protease complex subunit PrcB family protein [Candidatus Kaiserbacteria bacterium]